jgi:hypothetical protein
MARRVGPNAGWKATRLVLLHQQILALLGPSYEHFYASRT